MRLERIKCSPFVHAKDFILTPSYIIGCTGRKAVVLDREFNHLSTIDGLEYVYRADLFEDEKKLLLISNDNKFYVANLDTLECKRVSVRAPYNYNLEGDGCWSHDGENIFICIRNSKTINSAFRCYNVNDFNKYEDFLVEEYSFAEIRRLSNKKGYLLIGYGRREEHDLYFIYYDGNDFKRFPVESSEHMTVFNCYVDDITGNVSLYTTKGYFIYSAEGKFLKKIEHPQPKEKKIFFSKVFEHIFPEGSEEMNLIRNLCKLYGMEGFTAKDDLKKHGISTCGQYEYYATDSGFYITDINTKEIVAYIPEEYGVENFEQVAPDVIAIATWSGVKLYRILSED